MCDYATYGEGGSPGFARCRARVTGDGDGSGVAAAPRERDARARAAAARETDSLPSDTHTDRERPRQNRARDSPHLRPSGCGSVRACPPVRGLEAVDVDARTEVRGEPQRTRNHKRYY